MSVAARRFSFDPTPAVAASRARTRYVACPVCQADRSEHLFHRTGVRFVRCRSCGLVYVNPVGNVRANWFDIDRLGQFDRRLGDRRMSIDAFDEMLGRLAERFQQVRGEPLRSVVLLGRWMKDFAETPNARRVGLKVVETTDADFAELVLQSNVDFAQTALSERPQIVLLKELLEACADPHAVMQRLRSSVPTSTWFAVAFSNARSLPAMIMRRNWPQFFDYKTMYFDLENLGALMARSGLFVVDRFPYPTPRTLGYVLSRTAPTNAVAALVARTPVAQVRMDVPTGYHVAVFQPKIDSAREKLSIVIPVFNEVRYAADVIEAVLAKPLKIEREVVVVESNSTDGTREVVQKFEGREGVRVIYEDRPRGKGHAVRTGLKNVTGSIVLIQDADFEYDIDDYDALLEPILQHKASFVLGSRSLGLDDWKVRKFATGRTKAFLLNFAQLVFAETYNVLYQQHVTDVNTMFKVFRTEALQAFELECNGFELDIELACKLAKSGNAPLEVPVNYVARGFEEGKKIRFLHDSWRSYYALFEHRWT